MVTTYLDMLLDEWCVNNSPRFKACIRDVLGELSSEAHHILLRAPPLQVTIQPKFGLGVWAYFPVHKRRIIVRQLADDGFSLRAVSRVLLVISENLSEKDADNLRDHLGHVLLYLRQPRANNDCPAAGREWKANCAVRMPRNRA
jgi:hypothetical protein